MMVLIMTLYRCFPDAPTTLPTVVASLILLPIAGGLTDPLQVSPQDTVLSAQPVRGVLCCRLSDAVRRVTSSCPPGETALLSLSETPWAILLAVLILAEIPAGQTLLGGAIIMAAVIWYQWVMLRAERVRPG